MSNSSDNTKKIKYVIGIALIVGAVVYLVWTSLNASFQFSMTPGELFAQRANFEGKTIRVAGIVLPNSMSEKGGDYLFRIEDEKHQVLKVHYNGIAPNTFREESEVIVVGKLSAGSDTFEATELVTKCASKYKAK